MIKASSGLTGDGLSVYLGYDASVSDAACDEVVASASLSASAEDWMTSGSLSFISGRATGAE